MSERKYLSENIAVEPCSGSSKGFNDSLLVWINKPHVVNRRLCGSKLELVEKFTQHCITNEILTYKLQSKGFGLNTEALIEFGFHCDGSQGALVNAVAGNDIAVNSDGINLSQLVDGLKHDEVLVIIRQMLPKQPERHANIPELILLGNDRCDFFPLKRLEETRIPEVIYSFSFSNGLKTSISLCASTSDCSTDSDRKLSLTWIENQLLKKLARWSEQTSLRTETTSLRLLDVAEYSRLYSELKNKYGLHFAKIWPEKTNPEKYVFEDVAIATYLLCLWAEERTSKGQTRKQSFVDLGCGNGLLVHILASEGHPGYGIDVRRRSIWDLYGPDTVLKEEPIHPSDDSVFPDVDWLIGNHSDELTPWIPLMAARSSYACSYFVLPCCFWDFNARFSFDRKIGQGRDDGGKYRLYLDYIQHVGEVCGFNVEEDILRIPSTKRVCFVGRQRSYDMSSETDVDEDRKVFLQSRCSQPLQPDNRRLNDEHDNSNNHAEPGNGCSSAANWISDFNPRSKEETTRNCVTVDKEIKSKVIHTVFEYLLTDADNQEVGVKFDGSVWRKGGSLPMGDVVSLFDKELLLQLKNECGGLQTLLRNHCHIFQVSKGYVCLRDFTMDDPFQGRCNKGRNTDKSDFVKTTMCWFYEHHPDGCPKSRDDCKYAHGMEELRDKPVKVKSSVT